MDRVFSRTHKQIFEDRNTFLKRRLQQNSVISEGDQALLLCDFTDLVARQVVSISHTFSCGAPNDMKLLIKAMVEMLERDIQNTLEGLANGSVDIHVVALGEQQFDFRDHLPPKAKGGAA